MSQRCLTFFIIFCHVNHQKFVSEDNKNITKIDEGGQKEQTSSCEIQRHHGSHVQRDDCSSHCCMIYRKVVPGIDLKCSHHRGKSIFLYEMTDINYTHCGNHCM